MNPGGFSVYNLSNSLLLPHPVEASDPGDCGGDTTACALLRHPHCSAPEGAFYQLPQRHHLPEFPCKRSAEPTILRPATGLRAS